MPQLTIGVDVHLDCQDDALSAAEKFIKALAYLGIIAEDITVPGTETVDYRLRLPAPSTSQV